MVGVVAARRVKGDKRRKLRSREENI